ncbi:MAG: hypothetical protein HOI92_05280 [Alphaproteobacteria bacterium]|nr:hypothetical protein [Alphaproteobacteria bacterium]
MDQSEMDTEALIDRIRSLRDRIDVPASPAKPPILKPEPVPDDSNDDSSGEPNLDTSDPVNIQPEDQAEDRAEDRAEDQAQDQEPQNRTASIASNLADAMASLNEDVYDVYANKSDVTALDTRMQVIEQKLHKTQDMIVTLNRAVGRLIDYEEKQSDQSPAMLTAPKPELPEPHKIDTAAEGAEIAAPDITPPPVMILDRVAPDRVISDLNPSSNREKYRAPGLVKPTSVHSLWYGAAAILIVMLYFMFATGTTTSQPASSLPESDAFLNETEMAVYAYIDMGMARPLGITSLDTFSARMWEKGVDLPQYYECMVSIMDASTRPMNQMMLIELLDNPLRSDYNPAIVDRQRALFESRYGSADHYGGYGRARTNIESCRNW